MRLAALLPGSSPEVWRALMCTPKKKKRPQVHRVHDDGFDARFKAAQERVVQMQRDLHERAVGICASNNSRQRKDMDLPCALDAPSRYCWYAYEFGSHNFDFLRAIYQLSDHQCGVVGVDGDPNMAAHMSVTYEEFYWAINTR